ncbi:hypothetical protein F7725_019946 [Dissostichus mawsoni]|uniref:Cation efflux protein cytoplasmic domain-containing protein n=1 Tax=Dissostichus mawsoni TaxID=36200 RepID=A0A7J5YP61_DISMA|nr:hypothetical protein F7725_019946 [Dissostichus mawsoni]
MDNNAANSEKSQLIHEKSAKMYSLKLQSNRTNPNSWTDNPFDRLCSAADRGSSLQALFSSFPDSKEQYPDSKEQYPDFPFKNGGMPGAMELKRPAGAHCHGKQRLACEESGDRLLAKKKLYIASAVCLVFMIGEVIDPRGVHLSDFHLDRDGGSGVFSIERIVRNDYEIDGHPAAHGHSHALLGGGHSNTSVRAAFIHPEYKVADPICTFLFSIFVLFTTITILRDVFRILLEGIEFNSVKEVLLSVKKVKSMHSLHLWALTLGQALVSVHLAIEEGADAQSVLQEATELLNTKFGFHSITIQRGLLGKCLDFQNKSPERQGELNSAFVNIDIKLMVESGVTLMVSLTSSDFLGTMKKNSQF